MELETTPSGEVQTGMTEEQATSALLEKWGFDDKKPSKSSEAESTEEGPQDEGDEPTPNADDEPDAEDAGDEPDESGDDAEESGDVEIDVAGEKFTVPKAVAEPAKRTEAKAKEVEAGAPRKFQEAADYRKAADAQVEQAKKLSEIAHKQSDLIADHKMITRRLAQLEQINVQELGQNDPAKLTMINAEYNQLMAAKTRVESAYQGAAQAMEQEEQKSLTDRIANLETYAKANIKGWSSEYSQKLNEYAQSKGMTAGQIKAAISEGFISIVADAYLGHQVKTADPKAKKAVEPSKGLKPNASAPVKTQQSKKADEAFARVKKTGSWEDAANALLLRASARRKK